MQRVWFYLAVGLLVAKILNPGYGNFGQFGVAKNMFWSMILKFSLPSLPVVAKQETAPSVVQISSKCTNNRASKIYRNLGEECS